MRYKVLVIDDEEMIRTMLSKCLDAEGFLVYAAESAKKALELMSVTPDIILLDINMPEMDGLELCQFIRKHISWNVWASRTKRSRKNELNEDFSNAFSSDKR